MIKKDTTVIVDQMGEIKLVGRIIPSIWYSAIIRPSGTPDDAAIKLLSDLCYWYTPTYNYDESTSALVSITKKFKSDKVYKRYQDWGENFGITKRQVTEAIQLLKKAGIVTTELRNMPINGVMCYNMCFIEIVPKAIKLLNQGISLQYQKEAGKRVSKEGKESDKITFHVTPITSVRTTLPHTDVPHDTSERTTNSVMTPLMTSLEEFSYENKAPLPGSPSNQNESIPEISREHRDIPEETHKSQDIPEISREPIQPDQRSLRRGGNPEQTNQMSSFAPTTPATPLTPEQERKKWGCTNMAWLRYSPVVFNWNERFKSMSNLTFPKGYDPSGPNHVGASDPTKTLVKTVDFIDQITKGNFLRFSGMKHDVAKAKYKAVAPALKIKSHIPLDSITDALKLHQDFFVPENWPEDKKTVQKNILQWFYNSRQGTSWFLLCLDKYLTGDLKHVAVETTLDDKAINTLKEQLHWFEEPHGEVIANFTAWWAWIQPKIRQVEMRKGPGDRDLCDELGSKPNNAWHWIKDYMDWVVSRMDGNTIRSAVLTGKSKWAVNFIRQRARDNADHQWDMEYDLYDKEY